MEAQGAVTVNGTISANGWLGYYASLGNGTGTIYPTFGSGSGGGICLSGSTFTGAGTISARGGDAISGTVKGTGTSAGLTYTYASACGGGGRVAIATGADKAASGRKVKTARALVPPQPAVCAVTFDMGGGTNIWNDVDCKTAPIQVEKSLGTVGTVRYVDTDFTPGMILFLR